MLTSIVSPSITLTTWASTVTIEVGEVGGTVVGVGAGIGVGVGAGACVRAP